MATVVFACKSNSCRSQMAEGWAKEWIKTERMNICGQNEDERDHRLSAFLDKLVVVSVALDESAIIIPVKADNTCTSEIQLDTDRPLLSHPNYETSNNASASENSSSKQARRITCDDETCSPPPQRRKVVKEKAIRAMAQDGVDISTSIPKTIHEVLPLLLQNIRRRDGEAREKNCYVQSEIGGNSNYGMGENWKKIRSLMKLIRDLLELTSREMGMAYAGVAKGDAGAANDQGIANKNNHTCDATVNEILDDNQVVDSLVVLCSCTDTLKRGLSDISKETLDWDIDPPTSAAKSGEGDAAYLRVSRQIRDKVHGFMNTLKSNAMVDIGKDDSDVNECFHYVENSENFGAITLATPSCSELNID